MPLLFAAFLSLVAMGCYRATGLPRTPLAVEVIPETGGSRAIGLKAVAGPGDLFLNNDFLELGIDSTPYGSTLRPPLAGAASGGSIVDASSVLMDSSFRQVSPPADLMNRLTPVVNQDPNVQMVFTAFQPQNLGATSMVVMTGRLLDPGHTIPGATWDPSGLVQDVSVTHTVSMGTLDRFATLTTIVSNTGGSPLGIRNIGDFLLQVGGGYRFAVPATYDASGAVLNPRWGMEIPGNAATAFAHPLATAVLAPMVGLIGTESGSHSMDCHSSIGLMPVDADNLLVTSDPQHVFSDEVRPIVPARLVVGSLPVSSLAAGDSLVYNRRLYIIGGNSFDPTVPDSTNGLFNLMDTDKFTNLRICNYGYFLFSLAGTAQRQGPLPAEIRIERNVGTASTPVWQLARLEWLEPNEASTSTGALAASTVTSILPVGTYRVVARNQFYESIKDTFTNVWVNPADKSDTSSLFLPQPLTIQSTLFFQAAPTDIVCPEGSLYYDNLGSPTYAPYSLHFFSTHEQNSDDGNLQPMRFTFVGNTVGAKTTPDPLMRRMRTVNTYYSATNVGPDFAPGFAPGQYQYRGGNEMFGTAFTNNVVTTFAWLPNPRPGELAPNSYSVYGTRGPLSNLERQDFTTFSGKVDPTTTHAFVSFNKGLPAGWTSFDMPGPSQATTGGYNPGEKLASAMAEGVQVVASTEQDLQSDPVAFYNDFHWEFGYPNFTASMLPASLSDILRQTRTFGADPFVVGARTSTLPGFGTASALFTPTPDGTRNGGALPSGNWSLADFLFQAQGQFNVVHRPLGPNGLFTAQGFDPTVSLGQGANAWWETTGNNAFGKKNGDFDALELIRGESLDPADPTAWFREFLAVRQDWFAILKQQSPTRFTKALGLSSAVFSHDTPVGLVRTYLKANPVVETDLSGIQSALASGAAVVSTGPFLDVSVGNVGPGGLVTGPATSVSLKVSLLHMPWVPVDQVRVVVNGVDEPTLVFTPSQFTTSASDPNLSTLTIPVPMPANGKGAWIVVEAGVPLTTTGPYASGTPWNKIMRGIYPIAVTNPIFVDVSGLGYVAPGL